jgi:Ca2+-binding EF-hand superfamily protein
VNRGSTGAFLLAGLLCAAAAGAAGDREEFQQRAARDDTSAFRELDRNRDGRLTHDEVRPDLNFGPRFDDVDINRDGYIDAGEMRRYLEQTYGVNPEPSGEGAR